MNGSLRYLLDTNLLSELLKPQPAEKLVALFQQQQQHIAIAAPVWHELLFGAARLPPSRRRNAIESFLSNVVQPAIPILPYDEQAAEWHATKRARLMNEGRPTSFVDGQIAAVAVVRGLILVTANTRDFADFADLQLEDWYL